MSLLTPCKSLLSLLICPLLASSPCRSVLSLCPTLVGFSSPCWSVLSLLISPLLVSSPCWYVLSFFPLVGLSSSCVLSLLVCHLLVSSPCILSLLVCPLLVPSPCWSAFSLIPLFVSAPCWSVLFLFPLLVALSFLVDDLVCSHLSLPEGPLPRGGHGDQQCLPPRQPKAHGNNKKANQAVNSA